MVFYCIQFSPMPSVPGVFYNILKEAKLDI
uniref:Uncharacterized protein n=1 Tax=Anguilla anguilla TaxID=7936 RepID=A0A0E9T7Q1_ANGAN